MQDRYCNTASNFYANKNHDKFSTSSSKEFKIYENLANLKSNHSINNLKFKVNSLMQQNSIEKNSQFNSKDLSKKPSKEILSKKETYSSSKPRHNVPLTGFERSSGNLDSDTCIKNVESIQERIKNILWEK